VRGSVLAGGQSFSLDGAGAYAEKNWGAASPIAGGGARRTTSATTSALAGLERGGG
jgi:hypothetical protein